MRNIISGFAVVLLVAAGYSHFFVKEKAGGSVGVPDVKIETSIKATTTNKNNSKTKHERSNDTNHYCKNSHHRH